jgi:hypothetical protein
MYLEFYVLDHSIVKFVFDKFFFGEIGCMGEMRLIQISLQ